MPNKIKFKLGQLGEIEGRIENGKIHIDNILVEDLVRKHGIGRVLIKTLEQEARKKGIKKITLNAEPLRGADHPFYFYIKMGYRIDKKKFQLNLKTALKNGWDIPMYKILN